MIGRITLIAFLISVLPAPAHAADWVRRAMKAPLPAGANDDSLVVLLEERKIDVGRKSIQLRVREAVRIMDSGGQGSYPFRASQGISDKFKLLGAWKIRPDGEVEEYGKKAISQADADSSYEFSKTKLNILMVDDTQVGDVIAWEYRLDSPSEAYTESWLFGGGFPTVVSRFGIRVPKNWDVISQMYNQEVVGESLDDDGYRVWELRDLPPFERESLGSSIWDMAPRLIVSYGPSGRATRREFEDWASVGSWYAGIWRKQVESERSLSEAAASLTSAAGSPVDAIRAITEFTQEIRYLNVAIGRSVAEPHSASEVLRNRFGDCEDKSVLTVALLREIGVDAFPVLVRTKRRGSLIRDFPSPTVFDHAIVAIQAPDDDSVLPATIHHDQLGRLIIFDPTDSYSSLGDLAGWIQGVNAVVSHETMGGLVELPVLAPETSTRTGQHRLRVGGSGVDVRTTVEYSGQYASSRRSYYQRVRGNERRERVASRLKARFGDADVRNLRVEGEEDTNAPMRELVELRMPLPGKNLTGIKTMRLDFLFSSRIRGLPKNPDRTSPILIEEGFTETDRIEVSVPPGWSPVTPLPTESLASPVGDYEFVVRTESNRVIVERQLAIRPERLPAGEYDQVRDFFNGVARSDSTEIVFETNK